MLVIIFVATIMVVVWRVNTVWDYVIEQLNAAYVFITRHVAIYLDLNEKVYPISYENFYSNRIIRLSISEKAISIIFRTNSSEC